MFFNLDASNRPALGLEGRTCCYLHRVQTSVLALLLCFSLSHILCFFPNLSFFSQNDRALHFLFTPLPPPFIYPPFMLPCHPPCFPSLCLSFHPAFLCVKHTHTHTHISAWWSSVFFSVCMRARMKWVSWGLSPLSCEAQPNTAVSGFRSSALHATLTLLSYNHMNASRHASKHAQAHTLTHLLHLHTWRNTLIRIHFQACLYIQIYPKPHTCTKILQSVVCESSRREWGGESEGQMESGMTAEKMSGEFRIGAKTQLIFCFEKQAHEAKVTRIFLYTAATLSLSQSFIHFPASFYAPYLHPNTFYLFYIIIFFLFYHTHGPSSLFFFFFTLSPPILWI